MIKLTIATRWRGKGRGMGLSSNSPAQIQTCLPLSVMLCLLLVDWSPSKYSPALIPPAPARRVCLPSGGSLLVSPPPFTPAPLSLACNFNPLCLFYILWPKNEKKTLQILFFWQGNFQKRSPTVIMLAQHTLHVAEQRWVCTAFIYIFMFIEKKFNLCLTANL